MNYFLWLNHSNFAFCQWYNQSMSLFFPPAIFPSESFVSQHWLCNTIWYNTIWYNMINSYYTSTIHLHSIFIIQLPVAFWMLFPVQIPSHGINICYFLFIFLSTELSNFEKLLFKKISNTLHSSVLTGVWTPEVVWLLLLGISQQ